MSNIKEIRIYYESYEQAKHLVYKLIENTNVNVPIKFVRKKGGTNAYKHYSKYIAPIIFWKDQDILVTAVLGEKEIPLFAIELSTAVFTEDHELQRSDSMASALESGCIYIKYSPLKRVSNSDHGGNIDYDYTIPYRVMYQHNNVVPFHVEWNLSDDGSGYLSSDPSFLSCPPRSEYMKEIITKIMDYVTNESSLGEKWAQSFSENLYSLTNSSELASWLVTLKNPISIGDLGVTESSRTSVRDGTLNLKFNRFGHAMDPERGMLCYYGNVFDQINSTMILHDSNEAWYKATANESVIREYINDTGLVKSDDYKKVLIYAASLNSYDYFKKLFEKTAHNESIEYDITDFVKDNYLNVNKALRMIFRYSDSFIALDKDLNSRCILKWVRDEISFDGSMLSDLDITNIEEKDNFEEDEVTYIVAHEVLQKNDFKLISLSYPGAQGEKAILPDSGSGRTQQRIYIDVIAYLPKSFVSLDESKGNFDISGLTSDIEKLTRFRKSKKYSDALKVLLNRARPDSAELPLLLSISFWENPVRDISRLPVSELDFFVVISNNMKKWKIFQAGNKCNFKYTEGNIEIDKTYKVV